MSAVGRHSDARIAIQFVADPDRVQSREVTANVGVLGWRFTNAAVLPSTSIYQADRQAATRFDPPRSR